MSPELRRPRWLLPAVLLVAWLAVASVGGPLQGRLSEVQKNDNAAFLPETAESTEVLELQKQFTPEQSVPAIVVIEGDGRLTDEQLAAAQQFGSVVGGLPVETGEGTARISQFLLPGEIPVVPSQDGEAALLFLNFGEDAVSSPLPNGESPLLLSVQEIRAAAGDLESTGVNVYVSGPGGQVADLVEVFGDIDGRLLGVALIAVLIILLIVYRSPVLPFLVIASAVFALAAASALVYALAKNDVVTLNGQSQGILFILAVGAATDYALLLVARYREELHRHDDRYAAMKLAWRRAVEPIVASGGTIILALLCLLLSDLGSNKGLGPVGAIGIACAVLSALTFLPALLLLPSVLVWLLVLGLGAGLGAAVAQAPGAVAGVVLGVGLLLLGGRWVSARRARAAAAGGGRPAEAGRWVFWPGVPHLDPDAAEAGGIWTRVAGLVGAHPRRVWALTTLGLLAFALFLPTFRAAGTAQSDVFLAEVESVTGQQALERHFPAGSGTPTVIIAPAGDQEAVLRALDGHAGVESAAVTTTDGRPGAAPLVADGKIEIKVVLTDAPDATAAEETVRDLRRDLDAVSTDVLVGGTTAINLDTRDTATRDRNLIIPVVLVVIFIVLALLLRALVAPTILLVANVLSFAATLGVSALVFNHLLDFPGSDPTVPLYGFVFLVALGIDYSIFLMTRVREESQKRGTRPGILAGLAVTGGVITSAGIVLAATFSALAVLPLLFLVQIAFIVAFGVLLDTLIVRSLLVPAVSYDIGARIWWPSRLAREPEPEPQPRPAPQSRP